VVVVVVVVVVVGSGVRSNHCVEISEASISQWRAKAPILPVHAPESLAPASTNQLAGSLVSDNFFLQKGIVL